MDPQEKEAIELIRESRYNSNIAILKRNVPGISKYWFHDIVVTSGEGGQYIGKKALISAYTDMFSEEVPPVFERIPGEIIIADSGMLAWESGTWHYKTENFRGKYSAMWRKIGPEWLTQTELFVSLH